MSFALVAGDKPLHYVRIGSLGCYKTRAGRPYSRRFSLRLLATTSALRNRFTRSPALLVLLLAFSVRAAVVAVIHTQTQGNSLRGIWLDDEAAYHQAAAALARQALEGRLPNGLDHLGGSAYLGLITVLYSLFGPEALAPRLTNVLLGTLTVYLAMRVAQNLFHSRAALAVGVVLAVYPPLILWSATILRDALVSVAVLVLWWCTCPTGRTRMLRQGVGRAQPGVGTVPGEVVSSQAEAGDEPMQHEPGPLRLGSTACLALLTLSGLRPYVLGLGASAVALAAALRWFPRLATPSRSWLAAPAVLLLLLAVLWVAPTPSVQQVVGQLAYRAAVSRLEAGGVLYTRDIPSTDPQRGSIVARQEGERVLIGVVHDHPSPDVALVAFEDGLTRRVPAAELTSVSSARIPFSQIVQNTLLSLPGVFVGTSPFGQPSVLWIADALGWSCLVVVGLAQLRRIPPRAAIVPVLMVFGTILALAVVPGAPGNAARHRAAQTLPILVVLSAALVPPPRASSARIPADDPRLQGSPA